MKQFIGGRQRKIYTGPKGGTYYMKGGKKHYIKTKMKGGDIRHLELNNDKTKKLLQFEKLVQIKEFTNLEIQEEKIDECKKILELTKLPFRLTVKFGDNNGYTVFNVIIHAIGHDHVTRVTVLNIDFIRKTYTLYSEYMTNQIILEIHKYLSYKLYNITLSNNTKIYELTSDEINISNQSLHPVNSQPPSSRNYGSPGLYLEGKKITNLRQFLSEFGINTNLSSKITLNKNTNGKIFLKYVNNNILSNFNIPQAKKASLIRNVKKIEYIPPNGKPQNKQSPSPKPQNKQSPSPSPSPEPNLEECGICYHMLNNSNTTNPIVRLKCGHSFHHGCIYPWIKKSSNNTKFTCPMCRRNININKPFLNSNPSIQKEIKKKLLEYEENIIKMIIERKGVNFNKNLFNKRLIEVFNTINSNAGTLMNIAIQSYVRHKNREQTEGTPI